MARTASETSFPLDDKTIEDQPYPASDFDFTFDNADSDWVFDVDFNPDEIDYSPPAPVPEVEALRVACASGNLESVQNVFKTQWVDLPANRRIDKNVFGALGLCEAIKRDHAIIASYLLCNVVSMDQYHFAMATQHKSYSFLQLCVDRGWDINAFSARCEPPALSLAIEDEKLVQWFLSHGADPNALCGLDITPLSTAVRDAPFSIIKLLFNHGGSIEHGQLLHFATSRTTTDRLQVLDYILDKGAPINDVMFQNCLESYEQQKYVGLGTSLHSASENGALDFVKVLLAKGADPLILDSRGQRAVDVAEGFGFSAVAAHLRPVSTLPSEPRHDWTEGRRVGD